MADEIKHPVPKDVSDINIDDLRREYSEELQKHTCSTCSHLTFLAGSPRCSLMDRSLYREPLEKGPCCLNYPYYGRDVWKPHATFRLSAFTEKHKDLNTNREGDFFEVYKQFTGKMIDVSKGWFKSEKIREVLYYIVKNGVGFYCQDKYETERGFVPLSSVQNVFEDYLLVKFRTEERAIEECEILNGWSNNMGNLVYSSLDPLERKFQDLSKG